MSAAEEYCLEAMHFCELVSWYFGTLKEVHERACDDCVPKLLIMPDGREVDLSDEHIFDISYEDFEKIVKRAS